MGAILPFASGGAFEPNDIQAMSLAYEDICDALHINGNITARETIAVRVIELARRGERCPTVLRDRVLAEANGGTGYSTKSVCWSTWAPINTTEKSAVPSPSTSPSCCRAARSGARWPAALHGPQAS